MKTRSNGERGMSLIEVLVATAVLAIAVIISLVVYDAARKAFKKGENATEQQEATRIAYDRVTADLRMLGYNANPDGDVNRPDEQLEVGLDHAIIFRGDFDAEDAAARLVPEDNLDGGAFNVVSTGNDEIIGYVLANPDGTGPDQIQFQADVGSSPRDGSVDTVTINNVVLNPTNPPYTLYRVSLSNVTADCCAGAFIVRTPVVENIRNLTFQYYSASSVTPLATTFTTESAADKATRASVIRFNVSMIGMTRDPDMNFNDTADPASRQYRKFELRGDVVPRNKGMKGIQDLNSDVTPPSKPATPSLVPGHCEGLLVNWTLNPSGDAVTMYRVNYGTGPGVVSGTRTTAGPPYYLSGLTHGATYYISIQASDAGGNISVKSNEANAVLTNVNTPNAPASPAASSGQQNAITVNWTAVTTNTTAVPAGDSLAPQCRDLAGYRLYRGNSSSVTATSSFLLADETVIHGPTMPPYIHAPVINCHTYHYLVTAVDACGVESAPTASFTGISTSNVLPKRPENVQAYFSGSDIRVTWDAVVKNVNEADISIDAYDVYRSYPAQRLGDPMLVSWEPTAIATVNGSPFIDSAVPALATDETVYYRIKAKDECVNESDFSNPGAPQCSFTGTVVIAPPTDGQIVAGVVPTTVTVVGGSDTYTDVEITYSHQVAGVTRTFTSATPGTSWTDTGWLASPAGNYTIIATVTNSTGCRSAGKITVQAGSAVGCCLSLFPTTLSTLSCAGGAAKCREVSYQLGNDRCLTAVSVLSMTVSWVDYSTNNPRWQTAQFNGTDIAAPGTWTTTYVNGPPEQGTAFKSNFSPGPQVPYASPMTSANTTRVTYVFDKETQKNPDKFDVFGTNQYVFTLLDSSGVPSNIQTTCNFPTLTVQ